MKLLEFILAIILFVLIIASSYFIWLNIPKEPVALHQSQLNGFNLSELTQLQFYPNMRYPDKTITYEINVSCQQKRQEDIKEAFSILEQNSILKFVPSAIEPEIAITCTKLQSPSREQSRYFIAGEGGPTAVINSSRYAVIFSGSISLFKQEICEQPTIAIHELLHALGFDHSPNPKSMMYPVTDCTQTLDQEIISEINKIYEEPSLPDLAIQKLEARKAGRYISFNTSVENIGLKDIQQAEISVYTDSKLLKTFELGKIEIGTIKFLTITNLKGPYSFNSLEFRVSSSQQELSLDNNQAALTLST